MKNTKFRAYLKWTAFFILLALISQISPTKTYADIISNKIGHWGFENTSGNIASDDVNSNTAQLSGIYSWIGGKSGNGAINFNGAGKAVITDVPILRNLGTTNGMTVSLWVKPTLDNNAEQFIVSKLNSTTLGWKLSLLSNSNNDGYQFTSDFDGTSDMIIRSTDNSAKYNTWQYVTVTWDGTANASNAHIYINGVESATYDQRTNGLGNRISDTGRNLSFGANPLGGRPYFGNIDDVLIFDRVLTASDVMELYQNANTNITPPVISNLVHNTVATSTATIVWNTNEFATSSVFYGITPSFGQVVNNSNPLLSHHFDLINLIPDTTYYYSVRSTDAVSNSTDSIVNSFTTISYDNIPPVISGISNTTSPTRATISWATDEETDAQIVYGLTTSYSNQSSVIVDHSTNHSVLIKDLKPNTTYHYSVISKDLSGNVSTSGDNVFSTKDGIELCTVGCVIINNNDNWVFVGDSITDAHGYSDYLESYFHLRYPNTHIHFRNVAKGGTTIPDFLNIGNKYYDKSVNALSPNIVSVMFGHNGPQDADAFQTNLIDLTDNYIIEESNAKPIYFGPHPKDDTTGKPILGDYSDRITSIGTQRQYVFSDIWHYLFPIWLANLSSTSPISLQGANSVHPGPAGHLAIAYGLLDDIGVDKTVSSAEINAVNATLVSQDNTVISNIVTTPQGIDFTRYDNRLPMAFDDMAVDIFKIQPEISNMNKYMLKITGLTPGNYDVYIDGVLSASTTADTLSTGWNMFGMLQGPIHDQLIEVLGRIRDKEGLSRGLNGIDNITRDDVLPRVGVARYESSASVAYNNGFTGDAQKAQLTSELNEINNYDSLIYSAAITVPRNFSIRKSGVFIDTTAPIISNGLPTGSINPSATTTISVNTDETAICKYSDIPNTSYQSMTGNMNAVLNTHTAIVNISSGNTYNYYIKCSDSSNNINNTDYNINFSVISTGINNGMVAKYSFDENSGLTAFDSIGLNNGALQNGTIWGIAKTGSSSVSFDGLDDKITIGTGLNGLTSMTVSFWAKINALGTQPQIIGTVNSNTLGWRIMLNTSNRIAFVSDFTGTSDLSVTSANNAYNLGEWNYWTVTWDGTGNLSGTHIYKNGVEIPYGTRVAGNGARSVDTRMIIGNNYPSSRPYNGLLDDLRIYNRVLNQSEVTDLYNSSL